MNKYTMKHDAMYNLDWVYFNNRCMSYHFCTLCPDKAMTNALCVFPMLTVQKIWLISLKYIITLW